MKNPTLTFVAIVVMIVLVAAGQSDDKRQLARVQRILGKEVYVLCEPLRDYDIVEKMTTHLTSTLSGKQSIQKQMQEVINRANNRVEKGKLNAFDAAITEDGDIVILVKFKD